MSRFFRRVHKKIALSPGTVEYVGDRKVDSVQISILDYSEAKLDEKKSATIEDCYAALDSRQVTWINIDGLHDTTLLKDLGEHFGLHPLVLEDIVNANQRAKLEDYDDHVYLVLRMLHYDAELGRISAEQVSVVLGPRYVLSFQEREGDVFDPIRERIRSGKGRIRKLGPDYLAYALLDAVVDSYFEVFERVAERIEQLEQQLSGEPTPDILGRIYDIKREVIFLRKSVWPLREVVSGLERGDSKLIKKDTSVFLRDVYDHTIQVIDAIESFRDLVGGLQELYLSSVSNRMNEVMKVLTIIATIFVPLTFAAGIYGMNFEYMPELGWKWSYPIFWVVIGGVAGAMISFFRRRRWL